MNGVIGVPNFGEGSQVDVSVLTVSSNLVARQRVQLAGDGPADLLPIVNQQLPVSAAYLEALHDTLNEMVRQLQVLQRASGVSADLRTTVINTVPVSVSNTPFVAVNQLAGVPYVLVPSQMNAAAILSNVQNIIV